MAKKKTNWPLLGVIVGICAAPLTGGASLAMAGKVLVPTLLASGGLGFVGGKVVEAAVDGSNDDDNSRLDKTLEEWKIKNAQWEAQIKADQEETKRLREERKKLKHNNEEITRLQTIINNPHSSEEEKSNARKRIILLEDENKDLKEKLDKINEKLEELSKTPPPPEKPWTFPELGLMDKVIIAGGIVLLVYMLIPDKKK